MYKHNDQTCIQEDVLYLGMTRPALLFGLPYRYLVVVFVVAAIVAINIHIGYAVMTFLFGWVFGRMVFKDDYHKLNILLFKLTRAPWVRNHKFWKANSYDPY